MNDHKPLRLVAFASGRGSNVAAIAQHIRNGELNAVIAAVISNNSTSGVLEFAREQGIQAFHISQKQFDGDEDFEDHILKVLADLEADLVILAGYMKKMPKRIIQTFQNRMLNIHPALLPSFGGKGMYGHYVHEAVLNYGCKVSGVTVHLVDAGYDTGAPILQRCVPVKEDDTPETLAARVLKVEHSIYSEAIQLFATNRVRIKGRHIKILP